MLTAAYVVPAGTDVVLAGDLIGWIADHLSQEEDDRPDILTLSKRTLEGQNDKGRPHWRDVPIGTVRPGPDWTILDDAWYALPDVASVRREDWPKYVEAFELWKQRNQSKAPPWVPVATFRDREGEASARRQNVFSAHVDRINALIKSNEIAALKKDRTPATKVDHEALLPVDAARAYLEQCGLAIEFAETSVPKRYGIPMLGYSGNPTGEPVKYVSMSDAMARLSVTENQLRSLIIQKELVPSMWMQHGLMNDKRPAGLFNLMEPRQTGAFSCQFFNLYWVERGGSSGNKLVPKDANRFYDTGYPITLDIVMSGGVIVVPELERFVESCHRAAATTEQPAPAPVVGEVFTQDTSERAQQGASISPRELDPRMRIQAEAAEYWIELLAVNCNPTVNGISGRMAKWCAEHEVRTRGNVNPSAGTIRNAILNAKNWTPPQMSRAKAKKYVEAKKQAAQPAQVSQQPVAQPAQDTAKR